MATVLTEGRYAAEFIMSELPKTQSRDQILIAQGVTVRPGTVLGLVASNGGGVSSAAKAGGNTGNGTLGTLSVVARTGIVGVYQVRMTTATAFTVTDPRGKVVGAGVAGTPFAGGQVVFTITAGGTPFVAGDGFDLTVTAVPLTYVASPDTGANGTQTAVAVNIYGVDSTMTDTRVAAITRGAEINGKVIEYAASVNDATKRAAKATQLAAVGILVR